jgi:hypothetical protein
LERGGSSAVGRGRAGYNHEQQRCYHRTPTAKPETVIKAVELMMMGVRTPETCSAVHKRQVKNLRNYLI